MDLFGKEAISVDVGQRLKALREERGISMRMLARNSGLSANALSMIERGLTSPSVSTLFKIATALGVPITDFFREEAERKKIVFSKANERTRIPFLRGIWEGMGSESFSGRLNAFIITLENGANSGPHPIVHTGSEFVFCLRGHLEYEVDEERYQLETGDSLIFAAHLPHRWRNPGPVVCTAIIVISCHAEGDKAAEFKHVLDNMTSESD